MAARTIFRCAEQPLLKWSNQTELFVGSPRYGGTPATIVMQDVTSIGISFRMVPVQTTSCGGLPMTSLMLDAADERRRDLDKKIAEPCRVTSGL